jgi:hypothetical protein
MGSLRNHPQQIPPRFSKVRSESICWRLTFPLASPTPVYAGSGTNKEFERAGLWLLVLGYGQIESDRLPDQIPRCGRRQ